MKFNQKNFSMSFYVGAIGRPKDMFGVSEMATAAEAVREKEVEMEEKHLQEIFLR